MMLINNVLVRQYYISLLFLCATQGVFGQNKLAKNPMPNDFYTLRDASGLLIDSLDLGYYDTLGIPSAWQHTTGTQQVIVGLSDAAVDANQLDFVGKTRVLRNVDWQNGHGMGVAAIAVAQGNNDFGIPGVCYECGLVTTNYGNPN